LKIYNSTILCIVEFIGHLLSDQDTTSSTEMEAEEMAITNENRKGMGIKLS